MKYYVMADIHSFYTEMIEALTKAGYFEDQGEKKIIICGDLFDRGLEALKLQEFVLELMKKDQIILIKGNHEDLAIDLLNNWHRKSYAASHHNSNGTVHTVMQLTNTANIDELYYRPEVVYKKFANTPFITKIIPSMIDYYETENYIFVHGWIPCEREVIDYYNTKYTPINDWRNTTEEKWDRSRWINGMEAHHHGIFEKGKTIVCGHYHCSFGHTYYDENATEATAMKDFTPYYNEGIIAIDACTVRSKIVNCLVIED